MHFTITLKSKIILVSILFISSFAFSQEESNESKKDSVPYVTLYDLFKKKENKGIKEVFESTQSKSKKFTDLQNTITFY